MHDVATAGGSAKENQAGVTAIDELQNALVPIDANVTERNETLQVDQLLRYFGVRQRDDFLRFGKFAGSDRAHQVRKGHEDVALGGRSEDRRRHSFAHYVGDNDVQTLVLVSENGVEVAVD